MKFYVLGWDGFNLIPMTSHEFATKTAAQVYADSCAKAWHAFVVEAT